MRCEKSFVTVVLALGLCISATAVAVQSDKALADSALRAVTRQSNIADATKRVQSERQYLNGLTLTPVGADKRVLASVVFSGGKSIAELDQFVRRLGADVVRVEIKAYSGVDNEVFTTSVGDLDRFSGSLVDQVETALGAARFKTIQNARANTGKRRQSLLGYGLSEQKIYRVDVLAKANKLARLADDASVLAVIADKNEKSVPALDSVRNKLILGRQNSRPIKEVRIGRFTKHKLVQSIETNSSLTATSGAASFAMQSQSTTTNYFSYWTCDWPWGMAEPYCYETLIPIPNVSGDPGVDVAAIGSDVSTGYFNDVSPLDSGSQTKLSWDTVTSGGPPNLRTTKALGCNYPGENCPNDLTYTPVNYTGGTNSMNVSLKYRGGYGTLIPICTVRIIRDQDVSFYQYSCTFYVNYYYPMTIGQAISRIRFGLNTLPNHIIGGHSIVSTIAFKNAAFPSCQPDFNLGGGIGAPCTNPDKHAHFVPSAGYEDSVIVPNLSCIATRTG